MRVYGRQWTIGGVVVSANTPGATPQWIEVDTDTNGFNNDWVYVTAFIQAVKLNLNESPFYADWGIPAKPAVVQQVFPDYYMMLMQQRFAGRFASLTISKGIAADRVTPVYNVAITTHQGAKVAVTIPV
jgi:hypothetical protein